MGAGDHNNHLKKSHMTPAGPSDWSVFFPQPEQPLMGPLRASTAIFEYVPVQKCRLTGKSVQMEISEAMSQCMVESRCSSTKALLYSELWPNSLISILVSYSVY